MSPSVCQMLDITMHKLTCVDAFPLIHLMICITGFVQIDNFFFEC